MRPAVVLSRRLVCLVASVPLVLAGCTDGTTLAPVATSSAAPQTPLDGPPEATTVIEESIAGVGAPRAFRGRTPLHRCPSLFIRATGAEPDEVESSVSCMRERSRTGGELSVVYTSEEGDWIVDHYRIEPGTEVTEQFADTTRDRFGPRTWSRYVRPLRSGDDLWLVERLAR